MVVRRPRRPILRQTPEPLRHELPTRKRLALVCRDSGLDVPETCIAQVAAFLDRMLVENRKLNLTAIRDIEAAVVLHALDSFEVWRVTPTANFVIDLGSGNGFPGVVAACLWPGARVVLVERTKKKARAITRCLADTGLEHIDVVALDAAQIPAVEPRLVHAADLVVSRAMSSLDAVIDAAAPLMRHGSLLVQWKTADVDPSERKAGLVAARRHKLIPREDHEYALRVADETRRRRLVTFLRP